MPFDCIIPVGATCNITFLLRNAKLNKETTLFEWFISDSLNNITNVLLELQTDYNIMFSDTDKIYMLNRHIHTTHYTNDEFKDIFIRRRERLLNTIRSNKRIIFIRFEGIIYKKYTKSDIEDFIEAIQAINPQCDFKLLLISPTQDVPEHPLLITEFYDKHIEDLYCKGKEVNDFFRHILEKHEVMMQESP